MKSSIARASYKRTICGLIFWHDKEDREKTGLKFFPSIHHWVTAGAPDNVAIYDAADVLQTCGIVTCDATHFRGMWIRTPIRKPKTVKVKVDPRTVRKGGLPKVYKSVKEIKVADPKEHHKLSYG